MVLRIYGYRLSSSSQAVIATLYELGVEFDFVDVDLMTMEHRQVPYIQLQPFSRVPTMVDEEADNFKLFESRAISRYIVEKYGKDSGLVPDRNKDLKAYALFEQAVCIEAFNFAPHTATYVIETFLRHFFTPFTDAPPDKAKAEDAFNTLNDKLKVYDKVLLADQKYLAGDTFTLADLFHLAFGRVTLEARPDLLEDKPNVKRWWDDIRSRPSWQKTLEFGKDLALELGPLMQG